MPDAKVWWRWLRQWRREHLKLDRFEVLQHVDEGGALAPRYAFMTVMSCGIATLGLLQNSAAVIIGAMLISPLMGPIIELGMSLATFDFRSLRSSLRTLAVGVGIALLTAMALVAVSPLQEPTSEILARTEPTLFDLLVAVFSGLAGAYATVTRKGETIVGVAIATALMPPLAVVGFGLATGNGHVAGGAFFLFMTNLLAIALSVTIMARWYGFGREDSPKQTAWQATLIIGTFLVLSVPLGLALRDIAARGPEAFYTGANAKAISDAVAKAPRNPSQLTLKDLAAYKAKERPAVCTTYRIYKVCGMGPPSSGATTLSWSCGRAHSGNCSRNSRPRSSTRLAAACVVKHRANSGSTSCTTQVGQFSVWVRSV